MLRLYIDMLSQPSRAVMLFCEANNIKYQPKIISVGKGDQNSEEFADINPMRKVPAIVDGDFKLAESVAILKYLAIAYQTRDHWYPSNLRARAKVDEYMAWWHTNTRPNSAKVFVYEVILPKGSGTPPDQKKLDRLMESLRTTLEFHENNFLKKTNFLCGDDITIADLLAICEFTQLWMTGKAQVLNEYPLVAAWMKRVQEKTQPHFDNVHRILYKVRDKRSKKLASQL